MGDINYLSGIPLGKIIKWGSAKESQLTVVLKAGRDSDQVEAVDTLGVVKTMVFEGRLTGDFDDIQTTIWMIEAIVDGKQTSSSPLYSPFVSGVVTVGMTPGVRKQGSIGTTSGVVSFSLWDSSALFLTRGVINGDRVKNLLTGETAIVTGGNEQVLFLNNDIFTTWPVSYAVTVHINIKVMKFDYKWELPGLSYCNYQMTVMQVV